MSVKYYSVLIAAVVSLPVLVGGLSTQAEAQTTFTTKAAFDAATNTVKIDIPPWNYLPWSGAKCGPDLTGQGLGLAPVDMAFDTNNLNVLSISTAFGDIMYTAPKRSFFIGIFRISKSTTIGSSSARGESMFVIILDEWYGLEPAEY